MKLERVGNTITIFLRLKGIAIMSKLISTMLGIM